jgi:hypothetical protein
LAWIRAALSVRVKSVLGGLHHQYSFTTYHRGYIADMFFQVPAEAPTTDLTVFTRDVPLKLG